MRKFKSLLAATLIALFSAAFILPIAACNNDNEMADGNNTVYVTAMGGMALKNVTVELFSDSSSLGSKKTDDEGKVTYNLNSGKNYSVKVSDLPKGFLPEESYTINASSETNYVRINSKIIESGTPTGYYTTGDVAYDFEETYYTYANGTLEERTAKLTDFFAEGKKAIVINIFYNTCSACKNEYPALSAAYKNYSDKIEVIGLNDYPETHPDETLAKLKTLVETDEVPYLMCKDTAGAALWYKGFTQNYPLSVMIDRYGIVCEALIGNETRQSFWENWFEKYTSDDYSQDITQGEDPGEIFTPDEPGDFNAVMPSSSTLNEKINNTGKNILFSSETVASSNGWPWDLTEDETAIYPTNSGHRGTFATIYAQIDLEKDEVLAFDYKLSTLTETNYFYVSIDSRTGTGRQISMLSGVQDWQTGFAYAALEAGRHEIAFSYYKSTVTVSAGEDDKVYINNLRIVSIDEMNTILESRNETFEIPYFATREYDNSSKQFTVIEDVYLASDGYYHVGTKANAKDSDPYLMVDLTHSTPYFGSNSSSLYSLYTSSVSNVGGMIVGNKDLTAKFSSYISYSGNSLYSGLIPVTDEIKSNLTALYNDNIPEYAPYWNANGWLQFCISYRQYGVQQELTDPIKGLAYFSAFEAKETTNLENYVPVEEGTGQFYFEESTGRFIDVEGTSWASKGNYDLNSGINEVYFDRIIMPLGLLYKFVPERSGAYCIQGLNCFYINEVDTVEPTVDSEDTDASLFDGSLDISHVDSRPLYDSNSDRYFRKEDSQSFKINYYLEANKTYYISVNFRVVETTGNFAFRIDYLGETYQYLAKTTADFYIPDSTGKIVLPLYCTPEYDADKDVWRDKDGGLIYVDFTEITSMFDSFTIEAILDDSLKTAQYTFNIAAEKYEDGNGNVYDISLDLEKIFNGKDNIPECLQGLEIKDYTDIMKSYLAKSKEVGENDEFYGLVPVNAELYGILQLYNAKFWGYDTDDEWLKACWFVVNLGPNN
ncbi:MAG: redoxin domain-containing protein [Clostridia bacterium]|nr:redoxin domain-containing protein [Clostridia bacterium]